VRDAPALAMRMATPEVLQLMCLPALLARREQQAKKRAQLPRLGVAESRGQLARARARR
jgi:hypothetical protein